MLSNRMLQVLEDRGLDAELADRLGLSSEPKNWPVVGDRGETTWHNAEALIIPFVRNGEVVRRKFKRTEHVEGAPAYMQDKGGVRCAWNEDCLRDPALHGKSMIVTEGELDAMAALQSGFAKTISIPDGAPPPGERSAKDLEDGDKYAWVFDQIGLFHKDLIPEIIIAADGDANGAALLQDLSVIFGRYRCKFLTYPKGKRLRGPPDAQRDRCKDLNEVLEDYGTKGVVETIGRATWLQMDGVYRMSDLPPLPAMVIYNPRHRLFSENFKVRLGDFSVITGTPGFGKTSFANDVFCGIVEDNDLVIAWASFEQEPQRDHKRSLRSWYGAFDDPMLNPDPEDNPVRRGKPARNMTTREIEEADAWIDKHHLFIVPKEDDDATLEWLLERMELAVSRHHAKIIIVDPWNEIEHCRRSGETETEYIGRAIRALKRFAKAFQVHICVVAHPTKSQKAPDGTYYMPTLYDISGSANWYNKADLGVIVHRENADDTLIKVQKSRYHDIIGRPGEVRMQYSKDEHRFIETERVA